MKSLDTRDIYRLCKKTNKIRKSISENVFTDIISAYNNEFRKMLLDGVCVMFPYHCLSVCLIRKKAYDMNNKGQCIDRNKINWGETIKLWKEDEEARKSRLMIKYDLKYLYKFATLYTKVFTNNRLSFKFRPEESLMSDLFKRILNNDVKALEYDESYRQSTNR